MGNGRKEVKVSEGRRLEGEGGRYGREEEMNMEGGRVHVKLPHP